MHAKPALVALLPLLAANTAQGIRIIQSNDDGWAELYIRSFHDALIASGHDAVLSAPADNRSGSSKLIHHPANLATTHASHVPGTHDENRLP